MVRAHGENEIRIADKMPVERLRTMGAQVHVPLHPNEQRAVRGWRAVPRACAGTRHLDFLKAALDADFARDRFSKRTAARVARTNEQNLHAIRRLRSSWVRSRVARRRRLPQAELRADADRCNPPRSRVATVAIVRHRALAAVPA